MKFKTLTTISLLALSISSTSTFAKDLKHSFGLQTGVASGEYKNSTKDGDGFAQAYLFYNYQLFNNISLEVGYNGATELDNWECEEEEDDKWTCGQNNKPIFGLAADEFVLDGFVAALKGHVAISQRNSLYGKIGAQYYDYDFRRDGDFVEGDSGTGLFIEAGWQYRWNCGIGMNVGLRYQDMDDLTFTSPNIGINYAF